MSQHTVRVLDVGQCNPDHTAIATLLKNEFGAVVDRAAGYEQIQHMIGFYDYDLILVNRILDADGSEGLVLIEQLKTDDATRAVPVMMVSNFADAQAEAQASGAVLGFGKNALSDPATVAQLRPYLASGSG